MEAKRWRRVIARTTLNKRYNMNANCQQPATEKTMALVTVQTPPPNPHDDRTAMIIDWLINLFILIGASFWSRWGSRILTASEKIADGLLTLQGYMPPTSFNQWIRRSSFCYHSPQWPTSFGEATERSSIGPKDLAKLSA
ncbi:10397_t:CDS:2 [Ambispora gerdemannii]|uniref:10397_t:CDS:1 n=1 Tax=Ambispora gerdemannii TaxID=144530 RepID=A0A9N8YUE6_9GLOM|nr:10397_t:CDS:2 [Ambispora gerdemannii]